MDLAEGRPAFSGRGQMSHNKEVVKEITSIMAGLSSTRAGPALVAGTKKLQPGRKQPRRKQPGRKQPGRKQPVRKQA